ncbi:MAG: RtcB family protein, partial [Candidatus Thermoplasmatota archaeon]|nr:RtcB family protein [Candidatus Thermoplasmatota archaeon]
MAFDGPLEKVDDFTYEIPMSYKEGMNVPGRVYANEAMLEQIKGDNALDQVANVATLPGIVGASMAMPDIHWGYGFPIGGVAAFDLEEGVISPGGVGFDINCGVRLLTTDLTAHEVSPKLDELTDVLFENCPSGVGKASRVKFSHSQLDEVLTHGVPWLVEQGFGREEDLEHIEHGGSHPDADASKASSKAKDRGRKQIGSLGAGNHFLEVQRVADILDEQAARAYGIREEGQVCVMIHTGSRGYGHQVCTDYLKTMERSDQGWTDQLVDKQLACAPIDSQPAQDYYGAMCSAI